MFRRVKTLTASGVAAILLGAAQPAFAQATAAGAYEPDEAYIVGNAYFFAYHEAGHMLISELKLGSQPGLGNPEKAADTLATLLLIPDPSDREEEAREDVLSSEDLVEAVADGWEDAARVNGPPAPAGKHPPDEERRDAVLCLLYGSDATYFADLKPYVSPGAACENAFTTQTRTWLGMLEPHMLPEGKTSNQVRVRYDTPTAAMREAMDYIRQAQVLEDVAADINDYLNLPRPVLLRASNCNGLANATWNAARREMTVCYELVQWFMDQDRALWTGEDAGATTEAVALPETDAEGNPIEHGGNRRRIRGR